MQENKGKKYKEYCHFGVYGGKDKNGNIYLLTKDGNQIKPQIRKVNEYKTDKSLWDFFINIKKEK